MNGVMKMMCRGAFKTCHQPLSYSCISALRKNVNSHSPNCCKRFQSSTHLRGSSLFVSDRDPDISSNFQFDHALSASLKNKELLKDNLRRRGLNIDIDRLETDYELYLKLHAEKERMENNRTDIAKQVAELITKQKENGSECQELKDKIKALSKEGKAIKKSLKEHMKQYFDVEERMMLTALSLPNTISDSVTDEMEVLDEQFQDRIPSYPVDHYTVLEQCGDVKLSNVGTKAYYLKGRLAVLELELIQNICTDLRRNGFTELLSPEMFKTPIVESVGFDLCDPSSIYKLYNKPGTKQKTDWDNDLLFLRGASPLSFLAFFSKMVIDNTRLPLKMFTVGRHYTPNNNSDKKLPGLFNVLQSTKVQVCGISSSEKQTESLMSDFISFLTSIYNKYELPYRLVKLPASSLSLMEQNRIELQIWVPSICQYMMIGSVSQCGNYSSRRLMIQHSNNDKLNHSKPVYMVHGEIIDITKMIGLLMEYEQTN
ncbi:seryl-tRNA synthetase [Mactra antiquata]